MWGWGGVGVWWLGRVLGSVGEVRGRRVGLWVGEGSLDRDVGEVSSQSIALVLRRPQVFRQWREEGDGLLAARSGGFECFDCFPDCARAGREV